MTQPKRIPRCILLVFVRDDLLQAVAKRNVRNVGVPFQFLEELDDHWIEADSRPPPWSGPL